jgi:hypothetical protein
LIEKARLVDEEMEESWRIILVGFVMSDDLHPVRQAIAEIAQKFYFY